MAIAIGHILGNLLRVRNELITAFLMLSFLRVLSGAVPAAPKYSSWAFDAAASFVRADKHRIAFFGDLHGSRSASQVGRRTFAIPL
jgi:hypothetical protein